MSDLSLSVAEQQWITLQAIASQLTQLGDLLMAALGREIPAPQVHVEAPYVAVPEPQVIVQPGAPVDLGSAVAPLLEEIRGMRKDMELLRQAANPVIRTAGGTARVEIAAGSAIIDAINDVARGLTDHQIRIDYNSSGQAQYIGKSTDGTATSAASWTIQRFYYDQDADWTADPSLIRVRSGLSWDARATGW